MTFANNRYLSTLNEKILGFIENNSAMTKVSLDTPDLRPKFMRDYPYQVASWPIILSEYGQKASSDLMVTLSSILRKLLNKLASEKRISSYLNAPHFFDELYRSVDLNELILRHDVVFSKGEIKLIEVNAGTALGGWQHQWLIPEFQSVFDRFDETADMNLKAQKVWSNMLESLYQNMEPTVHTGNILIFLPESDAFFSSTQESLKGLDNDCRPSVFAKGKIVFCSDISLVKFRENGETWFEGTKIDTVVLSYSDKNDFPNNFILQLTNSYIKSQLVFPDSPFHMLYGNKHLMALMHEKEFSSVLTNEELIFIDRHIPYTCKLNEESMHWEGKVNNTLEVIRCNKDQFVIKKAFSMQGKDVLVGKFCEQDEWEASIKEALLSNDWIVQEYCQPDTHNLCDPELGIQKFQPIWGLFQMNCSYSGAFVRANRPLSGNGVINSANGAIEFAVYEEEQLCFRLSI